MSKRLLIDTNIFIDSLQGHQAARRFLKDSQRAGSVLLASVIARAELLAGPDCKTVRGRSDARKILTIAREIPVDIQVSELAGDLRRQQKKMKLPDALIAATAVRERATLVTRNVRDFSEVQGLDVEEPYSLSPDD